MRPLFSPEPPLHFNPLFLKSALLVLRPLSLVAAICRIKLLLPRNFHNSNIYSIHRKTRKLNQWIAHKEKSWEKSMENIKLFLCFISFSQLSFLIHKAVILFLYLIMKRAHILPTYTRASILAKYIFGTLSLSKVYKKCTCIFMYSVRKYIGYINRVCLGQFLCCCHLLFLHSIRNRQEYLGFPSNQKAKSKNKIKYKSLYTIEMMVFFSDLEGFFSLPGW